MNYCCQGGGKATQWTADPFNLGSIPSLGLEFLLDMQVIKQSDALLKQSDALFSKVFPESYPEILRTILQKSK